MRLLLDTNVFIWTQAATARLRDSQELIESADNDILVSAVTPWEIAIKFAAGRLALPEPPRRYVAITMGALDAQPVPIEHSQALAVAELPPLHRDPFDRLLVAQAIQLGATLVTGDATLARYPAETFLV